VPRSRQTANYQSNANSKAVERADPKLRGHAQRTARAWALDGQPLLGIPVFAVLGITLEELLARRFASFRTIYLPTAGDLREPGFELLATGKRPHYTIRLRSAGVANARHNRLSCAVGTDGTHA
jgi:hypothetical protein